MRFKLLKSIAVLVSLLTVSCSPDSDSDVPVYDTVIYGGTIYDGLGGAPYVGDVAINGDRIVAIGDIGTAVARHGIDAKGMAVSPGFINMLSWAPMTLIKDGRGMSDLMQGVTLEVFGEGMSMGPWSDTEKAYRTSLMSPDFAFDIEWTTLGEYLDYITDKGISPNVASYVGASTVRTHVLGRDDIDPSPGQLAEMQGLVRVAMQEGALGVGSSLIYAPAYFAETEELIALASAAGEYGGAYISHIRSESKKLEDAVEEIIRIAKEAKVPAEIYHLKASGQTNWHKIDWVFERVEKARAGGVKLTADMYTYPASATGLDASMPVWVQAGGLDKWIGRMMDPDIRARLITEIEHGDGQSDGRFKDVGPERMLLTEFRNPELRHYIGKTLADVAAERNIGPAEAMIQLIIEDNSRVGTIYFSMNEDNMAKKIRQRWLSFGSDAGAPAAEGDFLKNNNHPRAYGTFARLLGKYVRDEQVIPLEEAIRKLTSLPASNIGIRERGRLATGYYADVVVFDPVTITDHATFEKPHQYATGVAHVLVNGEQVLSFGEHTGATPGRVVRGPGWTGWEE